MRSSDAHLEKALEEYNDKVNLLEEKGETRELLDAYVNRGCILSMMESNISAIDDFSDAISIIRQLEDSGSSVDPGYFVKAYISRGELMSIDGDDCMVDDYRIASTRLGELVPGSKYYDEKAIIDLCITCAGDLIEADRPVEALPFIEKGMSIVAGKEDDLSRNSYVELSQHLGTYYMDTENPEKAHSAFAETIRAAEQLYTEGKLADKMDLVLAYISKGDMDEFLAKTEEYFTDIEAAIGLMKDMKIEGGLDNDELLSTLHGEIAQTYMAKGKIKEAEKHLLRQVAYNLSGSTDYLNGEYDDE